MAPAHDFSELDQDFEIVSPTARGADEVLAHDAALQEVVEREPGSLETLFDETIWSHEFDQLGVRSPNSQQLRGGSSIERVIDSLFATYRR